MGKRIKRFSILHACVGLFLTIQLAEFIMGGFPPIQVTLFGKSFLFNNVNGVMSAFKSLFCIVLVCVLGRRGVVAAHIMIKSSLVLTLVGMIKGKTLDPLPGVTNMLICLLTIMIIQIQLEKRERDSVTDFLTGLWNRRGTEQELEKWIQKKKPFYLLCLDLDNFKTINDNRGHKYGDRILLIVTERLKKLLGTDVVLGRTGGDEFVVAIQDFGQKIEERIEEIIHVIGEKMLIQIDGIESESFITVSVGYVHYPKDDQSLVTLMKYADIAMYQAKKTGKNQSFCFDQRLEREIIRQSELEVIVKEGLAAESFYLVFQPQYRINGKKLRGFETLLRLRDKNGENVSPGEFIPAAEKSDLIIQIDEYVINHAMVEFLPILKMRPEVILSVNVSAKNICRYGFSDMVLKAIEASKFPAGNLEIEITEYCLAMDLEIAMNNIRNLKEAGTKIALDDFGTGYASLSYLSKLSIDLLKIDKSFVDDIGGENKSNEFIQAVVMIGHMNECEVISEGVEKENQIDFLHHVDCDFIQGYAWGRPLPYEKVVELCSAEN